MFYTLQITAEPASDHPAVMHRPATIETLTDSKESLTDEEIEMVAEAFKAQVKQLLLAMVRMAPNAGGNATERSEGRVDHNVGRLTPGKELI